MLLQIGFSAACQENGRLTTTALTMATNIPPWRAAFGPMLLGLFDMSGNGCTTGTAFVLSANERDGAGRGALSPRWLLARGALVLGAGGGSPGNHENAGVRFRKGGSASEMPNTGLEGLTVVLRPLAWICQPIGRLERVADRNGKRRSPREFAPTAPSTALNLGLSTRSAETLLRASCSSRRFPGGCSRSPRPGCRRDPPRPGDRADG